MEARSCVGSLYSDDARGETQWLVDVFIPRMYSNIMQRFLYLSPTSNRQVT